MKRILVADLLGDVVETDHLRPGMEIVAPLLGHVARRRKGVAGR